MLLQFSLFYSLIIIYSLLGRSVEKIKSQRTYSIVQSIYFVILSVGMILIYCINPYNIGILIITIGVILNTIVIVANKGLMPVDVCAMQGALGFYSYTEVLEQINIMSAISRKHKVLDETTKFKILADRFCQERKSIGDFFIETALWLICIHFCLILVYKLTNLL